MRDFSLSRTSLKFLANFFFSDGPLATRIRESCQFDFAHGYWICIITHPGETLLSWGLVVTSQEPTVGGGCPSPGLFILRPESCLIHLHKLNTTLCSSDFSSWCEMIFFSEQIVFIQLLDVIFTYSFKFHWSYFQLSALDYYRMILVPEHLSWSLWVFSPDLWSLIVMSAQMWAEPQLPSLLNNPTFLPKARRPRTTFSCMRLKHIAMTAIPKII